MSCRAQKLVEDQLDWLARMDPNGLWGEYLEDFRAASEEHGELDSESLAEVIAEMLE